VYEDPSFPKGFDLSPCLNTVTKIKLLDHKLGLLYKRTTKQQPGELFERKTNEARTLPEYRDVVASLEKIKSDIPRYIELLEEKFSNSGRVNVRSEKISTAAEKEVCVARYSRLNRLNPFLIFQLSSLWRKVACGLAIGVLWTSKHRSGVAVNMTIPEWEQRKKHDTSSVVTVKDHKTGDKEPATVVLDEETTNLMER
jgi:hypothetical protein